MHDIIMRKIVEEVKKVHGEDRWPSDVEQKVHEISELLRAILRHDRSW